MRNRSDVHVSRAASIALLLLAISLPVQCEEPAAAACAAAWTDSKTTESSSFTFRITPSIFDVDLRLCHSYADWHPSVEFLHRKPGEEHYKLLSHLAAQVPPGSTVVDIGTLHGLSALALACGNDNITVVTYDLVDHFVTDDAHDADSGGEFGADATYDRQRSHHPQLTALHHPRIRRRLADCTDPSEFSTLLSAPLIFLDVAPHGVTESGIVDALVAAGYGGVVVLDDIRAVKWPLMQEYWHSGVPPSVTKIDVTEYGHSTGTGALVFDGKRTTILIADGL